MMQLNLNFDFDRTISLDYVNGISIVRSFYLYFLYLLYTGAKRNVFSRFRGTSHLDFFVFDYFLKGDRAPLIFLLYTTQYTLYPYQNSQTVQTANKNCFFLLQSGTFLLGGHNVTRISRLLEKLETRTNQEKKRGAYKEFVCVGGPKGGL